MGPFGAVPGVVDGSAVEHWRDNQRVRLSVGPVPSLRLSGLGRFSLEQFALEGEAEGGVLHQQLAGIVGVHLPGHGDCAVPDVPPGPPARPGGDFAESPRELLCVLRGGDHDGADAPGFIPSPAPSVLRDSGDEHWWGWLERLTERGQAVESALRDGLQAFLVAYAAGFDHDGSCVLYSAL